MNVLTTLLERLIHPEDHESPADLGFDDVKEEAARARDRSEDIFRKYAPEEHARQRMDPARAIRRAKARRDEP